ncbi:hypothetical protein INR49_004746 [Caranx melampygus]|nr:hypothetical protein INR49_004746 [Caranx melampygus]
MTAGVHVFILHDILRILFYCVGRPADADLHAVSPSCSTIFKVWLAQINSLKLIPFLMIRLPESHRATSYRAEKTGRANTNGKSRNKTEKI